MSENIEITRSELSSLFARLMNPTSEIIDASRNYQEELNRLNIQQTEDGFYLSNPDLDFDGLEAALTRDKANHGDNGTQYYFSIRKSAHFQPAASFTDSKLFMNHNVNSISAFEQAIIVGNNSNLMDAA